MPNLQIILNWATWALVAPPFEFGSSSRLSFHESLKCTKNLMLWNSFGRNFICLKVWNIFYFVRTTNPHTISNHATFNSSLKHMTMHDGIHCMVQPIQSNISHHSRSRCWSVQISINIAKGKYFKLAQLWRLKFNMCKSFIDLGSSCKLKQLGNFLVCVDSLLILVNL